MAPGTARSYVSPIRFQLVPYFGAHDIHAMSAQSVQALYDRCIEKGRPRSPRTIEMVITNLLGVQNMGGWQSPQVMLDTYTHFLPPELSGFADLAALNDTIRHQPTGTDGTATGAGRKTRVASRRSMMSTTGLEPVTGGGMDWRSTAAGG